MPKPADAGIYCLSADCNGSVRLLTKTAQAESASSPAEQDQNASQNGENRHYHRQTLKVQIEQWDQPGHDEPDAQQDHPQVLC